MPRLLRIFFTGMFISFLGSLPLGTLNIAALQISISDGLMPAFYFAIGALTAEIIYVRLSLIAMDWVQRQEKLFRLLEWITLFIVVALAASSFYAAVHPEVKKNVILSSTLHRFWLGLFMSALNPMQIPFWFGWSTVLLTKKLLQPKQDQYNTYIGGIGLGTLMGNAVFIFGGKLIADKLNNNQHILSWIIGGIFAATALVQIWKIVRHQRVQYRIKHLEEETKPFEKKLDEMAREQEEEEKNKDV